MIGSGLIGAQGPNERKECCLRDELSLIAMTRPSPQRMNLIALNAHARHLLRFKQFIQGCRLKPGAAP